MIFSSGGLQAQKYNFESKAAKKLYTKLEKAYDSYDYGYILENEQNLSCLKPKPVLCVCYHHLVRHIRPFAHQNSTW